ncbi:MAG: cyclic pyranopterin phosphate synthase [Verrucomicrobia bacterium]|nr:MAG: cyclic pyranopterin phosphate synthase [Verrucomicrobiota bacterium]
MSHKPKLTHTLEDGTAAMVDVSDKVFSRREATATGFIRIAPATLTLIGDNLIAKGDVLGVARIAAIQAAKQTGGLIPLCHPLPLSHVEVGFELREDGVAIWCRTRTTAQTGVEMEALTGVSVAALTIYDMCKATDPGMVIGEIRLIEKRKEPVE